MSEVTIDRIAIEVDASAAVSANGIDKLTAALSNLRSNAKLTATANQLNKLSASINSLKNVSSAAQSIRSISNAINSLAGVKSMANFSNAVSAINRLPKALSGLQKTNLGEFSMQLKALSTAVKPLESIGKSNLGSSLSQLKKLPEISKGLDAHTVSEFAAKIKELTTALAPLATEMNKVSAGFNALPKNINKALNTLDNYNRNAAKTVSNGGLLSGTIGGLRTKWLAYGYAVRVAYDAVDEMFNSFTDRYETMNLFAVSMGEYTEEAYEYAKKIQKTMGITVDEWAGNQATFMQLTSAFGVAKDQAYEMSKGLTQFTYDLASLKNMNFEEAFNAVRSGISGEIEPLRNRGIDLSEARLQEIALAEGITKKVTAMNQAEKSELRYIAITQQMPAIIGDLSRTLTSPANALRVLRSQFSLLSQTMGSLISVVVAQFIPVIRALVQVLIQAASAISVLLTGKTLEDWDKEAWGMSSGLSSAAGAAGDVSDSTGTAAGNLKDAADNAKKAKQYMMGWDELNVLDTSSADSGTSGSGGSGGAGGVGGGLGLDLDSLWTDSMLDGLNSDLEETKQKVKDVLAIVGAIGAGFAAWKIASGIVSFLDKLSSFKGFTISFAALGVAAFIGDLMQVRKYLRDIMEDGPNFYNVAGLIGSFAGLIGDALMIMGKWKLAAAFKAFEGLALIASAISEFKENGLTWDGMYSLLDGLSAVCVAIGIVTGNPAVIGAGIAMQFITDLIDAIHENWDAIKNHDWGDVEWTRILIDVAGALFGIGVAFGLLSKLKGITGIANSKSAVSSVAEAAEGVSGETSTRLNPSLKNLAANLGLGLVVIAEVCTAALLLVGTIALMGMLLEKVGEAWQPVIDNGETVATAIGVGVVALTAVATATALLGKVGGGKLAEYIAIGTGILLEISIATDLYLAEVWVIGKLLDYVRQAWEPVITNYAVIIISLQAANLLLGAIAAVMIGLGLVTALTGGVTIPVAIALGAAVLAEVSIATDLYLAEVWVIGKLLDQIGQAWQPVLANRETIVAGLVLGTTLLEAVGGATAALGVLTIASVGTLPVAIALGTAVLAETAEAAKLFVKELASVADSLSNKLAPALADLNGKLPALETHMANFTTYMGEFAGDVVECSKSEAIAGISSAAAKIVSFFTGDPFGNMITQVTEVKDDSTTLATLLTTANTNLQRVITAFQTYETLMSELQAFTGVGSAEIGEIGVDIGNLVFTGISTAATTGYAALVTQLNSHCTTIESKWSQHTNTIKGYIDGVATNNSTKTSGMTTEWSNTASTMESKMSGAKTNITTYLGEIGMKSLSVGNSIVSNWCGANGGCGSNTAMGKFISGAGTAKSEVVSKLGEIPGDVKAELSGTAATAQYNSTGNYLSEGIFMGMLNQKKMFNSIVNWKNTFLRLFKDVFEINSPSGLTADEIGVYLGEGVGEGLNSEESLSYVESEITDFASSITDTFQDTLDDTSIDGYDLMASLSEGLEVGGTDTYKTASTVANGLLDSFRFALGMENSTTTGGEFMKYGETMMLSLAQGMDTGSEQVFSTLNTIAATIESIMDRLIYTTRKQAIQVIQAAQEAREAAASIGASDSDSYATVSFRASGGTVPSGDLFMANEAGPELVGRIGNTTAVMNTDQIVEAVASGVASAVQSVMGSGSKESNIKVYLDGKEIYANQKKIARSKGREFDMGAFAR